MPREQQRPSTSDAAAPLRFDVFTLFPGMFTGPLDESILKRAQAANLIDVGIHDIRQWTYDRHHTADDRPYGGGAGMVMMVAPIVAGVEEILAQCDSDAGPRIMLMSAGGRPFDQRMAEELSHENHLVLICGHYEGIDARVAEILQGEEISIGNYVLTGGELPAMVIIDAVARLRPGVIDAESAREESHTSLPVEYPHYTRPDNFRGLAVPAVLLSGHHAEIARWRREQAAARAAQLQESISALTDSDKQ